MKKTPGDITILHNCTKNHDHMLYCSWDMARDRCNSYFSFQAIFCPFTPLTAPKIKISKKKWKKRLEISSLYTCVPKIMIRWCTVPEIWCATVGLTDWRTMDRQKKWHIEVGAPTKKYYWEKLTFSRSVVGAFQLMQISMNFKTSCYDLKIRGLEAQVCVAFLSVILFLKRIMTF